MLRILKVSGESLTPEFREGDFVLIAKIPFLLNRLRADDTIAFRHPEYGVMIKKIETLEPEGDKIFVVGTHDHSVDSRRFGPIQRDDILGKVIWHIRQPGDTR